MSYSYQQRRILCRGAVKLADRDYIVIFNLNHEIKIELIIVIY